MKTRTGFVSNSSTTSFTVAVLKDLDGSDVNAKIFDCITKSLAGKHESFKRTTCELERSDLLEEQKKLTRDLNFGDDILTRLRGILQDPTLVASVQDTIQFLKGVWNHRSIRDARTPYRSSNAVEESISDVESQLKIARRNLQDVNRKLDLIKDIDDDTVIVRWEEDAGFGGLLRESTLMLEKNGVIRVLERNQS